MTKRALYLDFGCNKLGCSSILTSFMHIFIGINKLCWMVSMETYLWTGESGSRVKSLECMWKSSQIPNTQRAAGMTSYISESQYFP